jgi:hypothetical protein
VTTEEIPAEEITAWWPLTTEDDGYFPVSTFGLAGWHDSAGVDLPELDAAGVDSEIAPLVLALNRAGIETFQSCQDIGGVTRGHWPEDVPRIGAIVVSWAVFPKLWQLMARARLGGDHSGWLCNVTDAGMLRSGRLYVAVLFPWGDLDAFIKAATDPPAEDWRDELEQQAMAGGDEQ